MLIMKKGKVVYSGNDFAVIAEYEAQANEMYLWPIEFSPCAHANIAFRDGAIATMTLPSFREALSQLTELAKKRGWGTPRVFGTKLDRVILPSDLTHLPVQPRVAAVRVRARPVVDEVEDAEEPVVAVSARRRSDVRIQEAAEEAPPTCKKVGRVRAKPAAHSSPSGWLQVLQET